MAGQITQQAPGTPAPAPALPTADEFFGPAKPLPTADEFFGAQPEPLAVTGRAVESLFGLGPAKTSVAVEDFLNHTAVGRVLDAFGQGARNGWGTDGGTLSPESEQWMRQAGLFNDYAKGEHNWLKSFNEALIRPAATALSSMFSGMKAGFGAVQGGIAQIGKEVGAPTLGKDIAALPEALLPELPAGVGAAEGAKAAIGKAAEEQRGQLFARALSDQVDQTAIPAPLAEARTLGAVGEPEDVYFGTAQPAPDQSGVRADAVRQHMANLRDEVKSGEAAASGEPSVPAVTGAPDIHDMARQIAPDVFAPYDALSAKRDAYRRQIADLAESRDEQFATEPPNGPAIDALAQQEADILGKVGGVEDRLTKKAAIRLDDIRQQKSALEAESQRIAASDTPEMAAARQAMMATDYQMRDLAPSVSDAYRKANALATGMDEAKVSAGLAPEAAAPASEPTAALAATEAQPAAEPQPKPEPVEATPATPAAERGQPVPVPAGPIAEDVAKQLVGAGRPEDEAKAAGALVQAHYEARAARFNGAKGTADELYRAEGPQIRGAEQAKGEKVLELAQTQAKSGPRGKVSFVRDARTTITLMKNADASTFLHETGHMWLEEMMHDARDEAAPADLVRDAQTVRNWLGAEEDAALKRAQHEKFARGFERYMMEGRAPSAALARVFAQFRQWLIQIYRTVARLHSPITDDIRDVFDRLLVHGNESGTVIAPERADEGIGAAHERIAETTAPADAEAAADRIRAEADALAKQEVPGIHGEINGTSESEAGGNPPAGAESGGDRAAGQPVAEGTPGGAGTGEVGAGRGKATASRGGASRGEQPVTGPNERFPEPKSDLIDKAGNVRLDLLDTPEQLNEVLRQTAQENEDFVGARRGVVSDQQVLDLADAMGVKASDVNLKYLRRLSVEDQLPLAARVMAARKVLVQSAQAVWDAMNRAATGTDADVMAYAAARERHRMIQETVSGVTAEVGRALRAFRDLGGVAASNVKALDEFFQSATGKTIEELRQEATRGAALDSPQAVSKFVRDSYKPDFADMAVEYWVNGLISGPITHTTYTIGNALLALWKAVPETAAAATVGAVRHALVGGAEDRVRFGEIGAGLHGILSGSRDGVIAAGKALRSGRTELLPGEAESMTAARLNSIVNPQKAIPGKIGEVARLPSRGIATIHSFFRMVGYEQALHQLAYREAVKAGLDGQRFAARVADLTQNPTDEMMAAARAQATEQTLMSQGGDFVKTLSQLSNKRLLGVPVLKFVMPFVHIGSNITSEALLQRSALGLLDKSIQDDLLGRNGAAARDTATARMAVGTAVTAATLGLAMEGMVNGSGPSDPKQAAEYRALHGPPNSVRIGDTWYDLHRLGPLGMLFTTSANLFELGHAISTEDASKVAAQITFSVTKSLLDESWMRGPSDLIQAVQDPARYGQRYVAGMLASFLPFSVAESQLAHVIDPNLREARNVLDTIRSKVPFASESLLPRRDIWGEPAKGYSSLPGTAIYAQPAAQDPIEQAMARIGFWPAQPQRKITGVPLNDQQYDDYSRIAGRLARQRLQAIVLQPGFSQIPAKIQQNIFAKTFSSSRAVAREYVKMQYPGIINAAVAAKLAPLQTH